MSLHMSQLQGISRTWAHLFGLPHIGCEYTSYETGDYRVLDGESCLMCGRSDVPLNAHHVVPRSVRHTFFVAGHELRSPLFVTCGSGTEGCHSMFHGGARYKARWEWDSRPLEGMWWSGELLDRYGPHGDGLFECGHYVVEDRFSDTEIIIKL